MGPVLGFSTEILPREFEIMEFAAQVAKEYGFVVIPLLIPNGLPAVLLPLKKIIQVNEADRPERQNFSILHEIAHFILKHPINEQTDWEYEVEANEWAADKMLPDCELWGFRDLNLMELKEVFPHCSHEVIARKIARNQGKALTIFDNMRLTCRLAEDHIVLPQKPLDIEIKTAYKTYNEMTNQRLEFDNLVIETYYIPDELSGFQRVIMFTVNNEFFE